MRIKVMFRDECIATALGYGEEYFVDNISIPSLIFSISSTDEKIPLILKESENPNILHAEFFQFDDTDETNSGLTPMTESDVKRAYSTRGFCSKSS